MNAPAPVLSDVNAGPQVRKFDTADLSTHGPWLLPRIVQAYPHLTERAAASALQNILYNNEFLFLCQDGAVALAQVTAAHTFVAKPIVWERFVWCRDPDNKESVKHAALFYGHFQRWAKTQGIDVMMVEEMSDVPHDVIKEQLGRIYTRQQQFARV